MRCRWGRVVAGCVVTLLPYVQAAGQVIPVKTAPIAEGDQFTFMPSGTIGMAGVSIAVRDTLHGPFVNPARAARLHRGYYFGSPSLYSLSRNGSAGATLPGGIITRVGSTLIGASAAVQEVSPPGGGEVVFASPSSLSSRLTLAPTPPTREAHTNRYAFGLLGHTFERADVAVAASIQWSRLRGVDGADLLYPGAQRVVQAGDVVSLRAGVLKEWRGARPRSLEAILLHTRSATAHEVNYLEFMWDPATRSIVDNPRTEGNYDRTHLWGGHLQYEQVLGDSGWTLGSILTFNRSTQPTVPQFGIMNVAGDPGRSAAYNAGVGLARRIRATTVAADAIYEPIWSRDSDTAADTRYRFSNAVGRVGVRHDFALPVSDAVLQVQAGIQARVIHFSLDDGDASQRTHSVRGWNEWVHAWGLALKTAGVRAHYQWRLTSGVERVGAPDFALVPPLLDAVPFPGPLPTRMMPVRVTTQQFSLAIPIR